MRSLLRNGATALTITLLAQSAWAQSPRSMSLVLLVGQMSGPPVSDDVPMSVRKALDELRGFLPFKSYRLYDTGVIGMPSETLAAVARLRGASVQGQDAQLFEVSVFRPKYSQSLDVALRDVGAGNTAKPAIDAKGAPAENLLAASVRVNPGETIVVGASRVRGDKALVLLITGMASPLGAAETSRSTPRVPSAAPFVRGVVPVPTPQPPQPAQPTPQPGAQSPQPPQPPQAPQVAPLRTPQPVRPQSVLPDAPPVPAPPPVPPQ